MGVVVRFCSVLILVSQTLWVAGCAMPAADSGREAVPVRAARKGDAVPADGAVIRISEDGREVYIDLGAKDRIAPGIPFACYDARLVISKDSRIATLEVVEVGEDFSRCTITELRKGRKIAVGDPVSNPVYHANRDRKPRFVLAGDFDLQNAGIATLHDRQRVEALIRTWGGRIDARVTAQTDYVVMGARPADPTIPAPPVPYSVVDERRKSQAAYDAVLRDAQRLAIPVMNRNRLEELVSGRRVVASSAEIPVVYRW